MSDQNSEFRNILKVSLLVLLTALTARAAGPRSEFATGQAFYAEGEFKKAVAHFQLALRADPLDADSYYWTGRSYQALADIALPFSDKYASYARVYLTKATELAPDRADYRRDLFNVLLDSAASSRTALHQAALILETVSLNDPEYESMIRQFELASSDNTSAEARVSRLLFAVPRAAFCIAEIAGSPSTKLP